MNDKKEQLLVLIRANPFISQQDLAQRLGLSRSAVAGHIASLTRERRLLGRAYMLPRQSPLLCIGGSNLDRKLRTLAPLQMGTSNPVSQRESAGGVARNVAENLARLGLPVQLITAVGRDAAGRELLAQAQALGIDTQGSLQHESLPTGSYTAVLDEAGHMQLALAQMAVTETLGPDHLRQTAALRTTASLTVLDLNLPADSLALLLQEALAHGRQLLAVAVSVPKMTRLPADLRGLHTLLLNREELSALVGRPLAERADCEQAFGQLRQRGLQELVLTLGAEGVLYSQGEHLAHLAAPRVPVLDVTGAGDAFAAGVCASLHQQLHQDTQDLALACRLGLALSALTLQTEASVHPELGPTLLASIS